MSRRSFRTPLLLAAILVALSQAANPYTWTPPMPSGLSAPVRFVPPHPWIALTFDDGPHPGMTEKLLALLGREHVPATFFVVGKMADRYPYLIEEIAQGGHELANHSYTHARFADLSPREAVQELDETRAVIRRIAGKDTPFYRPPGGGYSRAMVRAAARAGYRMVLWNTLTKDVSGASAEAITRRILRGAQDGDVVLMHSGMPHTLEALPETIAALRAKGYQFVTISTLYGRPTPAASPASPDSVDFRTALHVLPHQSN